MPSTLSFILNAALHMARDMLIKERGHNDLSQNREQAFWAAFQTSRGPVSLAI